SLVRWRLRDVSLEQSRVVMQDMPTCANCHSFSQDGQTLAIDVDGPQGDKGAYAIVPIEKQMSIAPENVITWNSFPEKPPEQKTIGFMSQVSPDGQYVVTTVNESVFVANFLDYKFLQVFYPTRGILAVYSRKTGEMKALPGADDPNYVHCSPVWSPDGETIVFARAKARDPYDTGKPMPQRAGDPAEVAMRYDLYRIPFRDGAGGVCEPIAGASGNSMSNTFPKVSPDGRWIVSVQSDNGMLMRPDSKLWIVPTAGGEARLMRCNTSRMNSWHSFSPNGRWLVFSSKANTPYTQMMLTHIDPQGNDSPPILIPQSTAANRAVNLPEFVNIAYDAMQNIAAPAVEPFRRFASGQKFAEAGLHLEAVAQYEKALVDEPEDWRIHLKMGESLTKLEEWPTAQIHLRKALARRPNLAPLQYEMAQALIRTKDYASAKTHLDAVIQLNPKSVTAWCNRATVRRQTGDSAGALADYDVAIRLDPNLAAAWYNRGFLRLEQQDWNRAVQDLERFLELSPPNEPRLARVEAELTELRSKLRR
ncbi:MAG TPA: tetratricopeptide repeat protein, partial [Thermoguttaceae bacterium]|nr:tetratricopeptide repeat protein [Thermoguttaceae bacterium]